ncbi:MAG: HDIG domain-containing metalloprotein [Candidatus Bathyarchaeia archaeon]
MIEPELKEIANMIGDPELRRKVMSIMRGPRVNIQVEEEGLPVATSPAGITRHHSYTRGLVDHIVSTARVALSLCDVIEDVYHGKVNRDYVVAGVLLHDIMKPLTYREKDEGGYQVTHLGQRLDHLTLIVAEGYRKRLPLGLLHILTSHHGEAASPIGPRTLEALVVSLSDLVDSRLVGDILRAAQFGVRDCIGEEVGQISAEEAFSIVYARQTRGCDGVKAAFDQIKQRRASNKK